MLRYIGKGFLVGVPARDLTDAEAAEYGKAKLLKSGLYQEPKKGKKNLIENATHSGLESEEVSNGWS